MIIFFVFVSVLSQKKQNNPFKEIIQTISQIGSIPGFKNGMPNFNQIQQVQDTILKLVPDFGQFLGEEDDTNMNFDDFLEQLEDEDESNYPPPLPPPEYQEEDTFLKSWEEKMINFEPEFLFSFEIEYGQSEVLYETISKATRVRGAYFIPISSKDSKIDFQIKRENGDIIYNKMGVQEDLFELDLLEKGEYALIFSNKKSKNKQLVTFAFDVHNATTDHLQHHDINPFQYKLDQIDMRIKDNYFETKFSQIRQEEGYQVLNKTHYKLMIFTFIETIAVISVNIWQVYYIKKILENKRLI